MEKSDPQAGTGLVEPNPYLHFVNGTKRCSYYLQKKRRHCKSVPHQDQDYCQLHSYLFDSSLRKRIPCPLEPRHTCFEDQLQKHLKKCIAREELRPVYYAHNMNSGELAEDEKSEEFMVSVKSVEVPEIEAMVKRVQTVYEAMGVDICEDHLFHECLREETEKPNNGAAAQKHLQQQASLVGHIEKMGFLKDNTCFIEFGAGKGGLSHWVQLALKDCSDVQFVLVDRGSVRYKKDVYHKGEDQGPDFERLKIDIQHLNLSKVSSLQLSSKPQVGIGKHLCGGATDLMLRCITESCGQHSSESKKQRLSLTHGIVLALCCHHRCDWQTYVGKDFFKKNGFTARDFHLLCTMTAWATCGTKPVHNSNGLDKQKDSNAAGDQPEGKEYKHFRYGKMLPQEREYIGYQCKRLIDAGRIEYLKSKGYDAKLVYYIDKKYTLETVALLAKIKE